MIAACALSCLAAPVAAESVFERFYPAEGESIRLPYPFGALIADLAAKSGGADIKTAFIPLGRSLQRYAAEPDFFQSPRIVSGVIGEGNADMTVKDRLYFGYQPASRAIEIISYDEARGRFVFSEVTEYGAEGGANYHLRDDAMCAGCHQANGPIFAAAPWAESNANPAVVAKLAKSVEGLPVMQDFDGVDLLDRSARRANRLTAAAMIWRAGCVSPACRMALLNAALQIKTTGSLDQTRANDFVEPLTARWPSGIVLASPKIPDRDPLAMLRPPTKPSDVIEALGAFDPETRREPVVYWSPGHDAAEQAARLMADLFAPARLRELLAETSR